MKPQIYSFGQGPAAVAEGYKFLEVYRGSESGFFNHYGQKNVIGVRGDCLDRNTEFEFGVYVM